jgi:hypothetical protein
MDENSIEFIELQSTKSLPELQLHTGYISDSMWCIIYLTTYLTK